MLTIDAPPELLARQIRNWTEGSDGPAGQHRIVTRRGRRNSCLCEMEVAKPLSHNPPVVVLTWARRFEPQRTASLRTRVVVLLSFSRT